VSGGIFLPFQHSDKEARCSLTLALSAFKPRLLLLAPFLSIITLLLHLHERSTPLPSLIGVSQSPPSAGTTRLAPVSGPKEASMSATTGADGEPIPAVPPKEAESSVDYYMNIQAIQNTMGWM
jgi:hypothetical protein